MRRRDFIRVNGFEALGDNVDELARAFIDAKPDVVIAGPELQLRALQKLTDTVPIAGMSEDMVDEGLVTSLAHPGGNITGISLLSPELDSKRQDILIEAVPEARRIAAMADARVTPAFHVQSLQHAAKSRGVEVSVFSVGAPDQIASAIDAAKASGVGALNLHRCFRSQEHRIIKWLWSGLTLRGFPQFFNGLRLRKRRARFSPTVRVS
jgi:putative tryptophan/tyrosine transport system substrate-binding protein